MTNRITLPRLLGFRLKGFQPVFNTDVGLNLNGGPYVILGGNGLGKTTLIQAVVYGLTGGLSETVEENKSLRWDHSYFKGQLDANQLKIASVEVDFSFGNSDLTVRRGFTNSGVAGFKQSKDDWIENASEAKSFYEEALFTYGGYRTTEDFSFIVNNLLFLSESRRLIAWDIDAQVRILMLINQDVVVEKSFRARRDYLVLMDSEKRHMHVALRKIKNNISELQRIKGKSSKKKKIKSKVSELNSSVYQLGKIVKEKNLINKENRKTWSNLTRISDETEELREKLEKAEAYLMRGILEKEERSKNLAIYKLVENGICPVCGIENSELHIHALDLSKQQKCVICGSQNPHEPSPEISTYRSQLAEKIRSQKELENKYRNLSDKLLALQEKENNLQRGIDELRVSKDIIKLAEYDKLPDKSSKRSLVEFQQMMEVKIADLEARILRDKEALEQDFQNFRNAIDERKNELREAYKNYATQFLGLNCELVEQEIGKLTELTRFIPHFNDKLRVGEKSCSESQRFFLDIAFRMALIDMSSSSNDIGATFFCETPETALDISYIENVNTMFYNFTQKGHNILLTANIQPSGIAEKLLLHLPKMKRKKHILNLLGVGQLSSVHIKSMNELTAVVNNIQNGEKITFK